MKQIARIRFAKLMYALAGWLAPIKTYQRTYEWMGPNLDDENEDAIWENSEFEYAGRAWLPCRASLRLLSFSQKLDWEHFSHWALEHEPDTRCHGAECHVCGGFAHSTNIGNLNEEVA